LHKEPEGSYTVSVPALPGCITFGETVENTIEMAKEAIELYIEELQERGEVILFYFINTKSRKLNI